MPISIPRIGSNIFCALDVFHKAFRAYGGEKLNKRIKRYLEEIEKTEKKIAELQRYLKGVQAALKQEENNEMIKSIRGMKLNSQELFELLNGIQDGSIQFQPSEPEEAPMEENMEDHKQDTHWEQQEREDQYYGEDQRNE